MREQREQVMEEEKREVEGTLDSLEGVEVAHDLRTSESGVVARPAGRDDEMAHSLETLFVLLQTSQLGAVLVQTATVVQ